MMLIIGKKMYRLIENGYKLMNANIKPHVPTGTFCNLVLLVLLCCMYLVSYHILFIAVLIS